jgi:hypothetical protein
MDSTAHTIIAWLVIAIIGMIVIEVVHYLRKRARFAKLRNRKVTIATDQFDLQRIPLPEVTDFVRPMGVAGVKHSQSYCVGPCHPDDERSKLEMSEDEKVFDIN